MVRIAPKRGSAMDFGIVKTLQTEWAAVMAAPWSVATIAAIALFGGFGIAALYYGGTLSTLRERVQFYQDQFQSAEKAKGAISSQKSDSATSSRKVDVGPPVQPQYLKSVGFGSDFKNGMPVFFSAEVVDSVARLDLYIDYSFMPLQFRGGFAGERRRIKIGALTDLVRSTQIGVRPLAGEKDGSGNGKYFWGDPTENFPIGAFSRARLVIIGPDRKEQRVYLEVTESTVPDKPLTIVQNNMNWVQDWEGEYK
jgi:hypothetical protein